MVFPHVSFVFLRFPRVFLQFLLSAFPISLFRFLGSQTIMNGAKTKYIIFAILQDFEYSFDLNNDKEEKVGHWKVLGMIFQEKLS